MPTRLLLTTWLLIMPHLLFFTTPAAPGPAVQQTYTISGRVKRAGTPNSIAGVTMTLRSQSGAVVKTTRTAVDGTYSLTGVPAGASYVLTLTLVGHTFSPPTKSYANLSARMR